MKKIWKNRNEGVAAIIVGIPCLVAIGGSVLGATVTKDWNDWGYFIIGGIFFSAVPLLMLLDALGAFDWF